MSAAGTGELQFIEGTMNASMYCDILKQSMIRFLQRLGLRAVFQHDNDPKHTSKTTTALLKKLRVKVMDWPSMSPDLNPIKHLWGILKWKVKERKVCNIHQLHDVVMEEWKRTPAAACEALVNSMPKKGFIKAKNYPPSTNVETENDGSESSVFRQLFQKWTLPNQSTGLGKTNSLGKIAKVEQVKFDATSLHAKPEVAAQHKMVDDGSGEAKVRTWPCYWALGLIG
ncbi:Villin-1 [Varanus komodoensis]|nr:Villin-1 [Varanus komodoensis]